MSAPQPPSPSDSRLERDFIELATLTLEDAPGARDEARGELMARLMQSPTPDRDARLESALSRMAKVLPTPWQWRGVLSSAAVLLTLLVLLGIQVFIAAPEIQLFRIGQGKGNPQAWFDKLPEADRDFIAAGKAQGIYSGLFGGQPRTIAGLDRYRQAYPDDPAVFEYCAQAYIREAKTLPPGYEETWKRIDPDNGIWNLLAAVLKSARPAGTGTPPPEDLAEARRLLDAALSAPYLDTRIPELSVRRLAKFPLLPQTFVGNSAGLRFAEPVVTSGYDVSLTANEVSRLFHILAMHYSTTRDQDGQKNQERLRSLIPAWRELSARLLLESNSYGNFHSKLYLLSMGSVLESSAGALNLGTEEKRVGQLLAEIERIVPIGLSRRSGRYGLVTIHPGVNHTEGASTLAKRRAERSRIGDPPEAYLPGRLSEIAAVDRFLAMASALLLLPVMALAWFESFRRGRRVNGLADGLRPLFSWADTAWTITLGCVLPLLWYWGITRLTPLGLHDLDLAPRRPYLAPALQGFSALLLSLVLMLQALQWRLHRRLGFLGLAPRHLWIGWAVAGFTAALLPSLGALRSVSSAGGPEILYGFIAACGIPLLWLLWQAGALLFSPGSSALAGVLLARLLIAPLAVACALMLGIQIPLKSIEQHWLSLDEVTRCDLSQGGIPPAEAKKVEELARRLASVLRDTE
ncbi:hypothetical protein [Luteolibacter luteus]|uniref:Uncharacterized protein n=1 Tax=Luteolibacter luteus TaxID=2728835 RepID=A0A858RHR6_9BACT|nr:hypothetical protein [Luteolibacter luteus]QJE96726.1 hypothetical protein HHL09_13350 [Luteolibacter luteus]